MKDCVQKCLGQVIISCQAYSDTPLYGEQYIEKMAECAVMGGAKVIRACWPENIRAVRKFSRDLVIIGINKAGRTSLPEPGINITPTFESAREVIEAGADIVAVDTRLIPQRGKEELLDLLKKIRTAYPDVGIMGDSATYEDAMFAAQSGYLDIVSTTLSVMVEDLPGPNVELVRRLKASTDLPVNAEGHIWELADIQSVVDAGCDMCTIGTAVTRPQLITKRFVDFNQKIRS